MGDLEQRVDTEVDFDTEFALSLIPVYGEPKFYCLTEDTDLSPVGKLAMRTLFYGGKYGFIGVMGKWAYEIVNVLS